MALCTRISIQPPPPKKKKLTKKQKKQKTQTLNSNIF